MLSLSKRLSQQLMGYWYSCMTVKSFKEERSLFLIQITARSSKSTVLDFVAVPELAPHGPTNVLLSVHLRFWCVNRRIIKSALFPKDFMNSFLQRDLTLATVRFPRTESFSLVMFLPTYLKLQNNCDIL